MGCVWRSAMPLLSTLAALVIIVHSQEDLEREHPYDLRARSLDVGTPNYDQPWRAMDVEPMTYQTTPGEDWHDHDPHEEPPRRRRLGRKRKRRPMSNEDLQPQERTITHPEDNLPYYEPDYNPAETTEAMPRRRKKQKRRNNWTEENGESERPLRRRGIRRKRPSLDWPVNEFKEFRSQENPPEIPRTEQKDPTNIEESNNDEYEDRYRIEQKDTKPDFAETPQLPTSAEENTNVQIQEDKSLSDFSMEVYSPDRNERFKDEDTPRSTVEDKTSVLVASLKRNGPVDPMKLKELLKRSHGASLSEILQQHNLTLADLLQGKENSMKYPSLKQQDIIENKQKQIPLNNIKHNYKQQFNAENRFQDKTANLVQAESRQEDKTTNLVNVEKRLEDITTDSVNFEKKTEDKTTDLDATTIKENKTSIDTTVVIIDATSDNSPNTQAFQSIDPNITTTEKIQAEESIEQKQETLQVKENAPKIATKRRYPGMLRRKLRMRPSTNNTQYKSPLNRDLIALTAKRYLKQNSRNVPKSREWKDALPAMLNASKTVSESLNSSESSIAPSTTASATEETTVDTTEYNNPTTIMEETTADEKNNTEDNEDKETYNNNNNEDKETTQMSTTPMATFETTTTERITTTERVTTRVTRPTVSRMGLRRQAFNNRLKRKRMKIKNSTTEAPDQENFMKDLFGIPNLVSSSEFIAKTQIPNQTPKSKSESTDFTALDDFFTTTESGKDAEVAMSTKILRNVSSTSPVSPVTSTTEESAKIEIEEILNDTRASARLSRILMERNMTLTELVEHRERGSSHVHLADIFHNASKEPKPPEPFLSKSLIEPISKETYPLRALLEANLHDPTVKMTTLDPTQTQAGIDIPVVMDFGNNVNENGETMGIISLFNKYTGSDVYSEKSTVNKDSEGTPYVTTVVTVDTNTGDNTREGRVLKDDVDSMKQDIVNWNELFAIIRRNNKNESEETTLTKGLIPLDTHETKKVVLEEDLDGDGLIVLEDLQHLKDFDNNIASASDEKLEVNTHESVPSNEPGISNNAHSHTKSVTVATASIVGLSMILFLLTYAAFKWNQQRRMLSKKQSFCEERIPTPVFENRKGHKNNCSTRSISPMLTNSNIYTMTTLESQNGKESPEYAWDSLRKPFQ